MTHLNWVICREFNKETTSEMQVGYIKIPQDIALHIRLDIGIITTARPEGTKEMYEWISELEGGLPGRNCYLQIRNAANL